MTQATTNAVRRLVGADTDMAPGEREAWTRALERGILEYAAEERTRAAGAARTAPLTGREAGALLGVNARTVRNWANLGYLRKARPTCRGSTLYVTAASVQAVLRGEAPRPRRGYRMGVASVNRRGAGAMDFHAPPGNAANLSETGAATPGGARRSGATSENRGTTR